MGYKRQSKSSEITQPGSGRNRVTQLPFLSSLSTEHPAACAPASVPGGATFAAHVSGLADLSRTEHITVLWVEIPG